ncbi:MAG: hypothetical protein QXR97_00135 [Thermoproteota archaeon]
MLPESRFLSITSDGKGVSQAITTVILVMAVMSVSLAAFFFTQLNLTMQSEQAEFENAKEAMVNLARIIENLEEGDAQYLTLSINNGGLELTRGLENIRITIWSEDDLSKPPVSLNLGKVNLIKIRGGAGVSGPSFRVLKGDRSINDKNTLLNRYIIISPDNPSPMGIVYQEWDRGAWIIIDFGRVRAMPSGTILQTDNGEKWYRVSTVDIVYFNITFGEISSSGGTYNFHVRIKDVKRYDPEKFHSSTVNIHVERWSEDGLIHYENRWEYEWRPSDSDTSSSDNRWNLYWTLVYLTVVNVEVSVR